MIGATLRIISAMCATPTWARHEWSFRYVGFFNVATNEFVPDAQFSGSFSVYPTDTSETFGKYDLTQLIFSGVVYDSYDPQCGAQSCSIDSFHFDRRTGSLTLATSRHYTDDWPEGQDWGERFVSGGGDDYGDNRGGSWHEGPRWLWRARRRCGIDRRPENKRRSSR
jgi:hypothetical protein